MQLVITSAARVADVHMLPGLFHGKKKKAWVKRVIKGKKILFATPHPRRRI